METISKMRKRGVRHEQGAPLLRMSDVSLAYVPTAAQARQEDERYVLYDVSFEVDVGQQIAVVGPNGAGKSTLFKVIAGTLEADEGRIEIFGHDPGRHICIAYVPQRSQIDWAFPVTVEDVVMMGRVGQIGLFRRPGQRDRQIVHSSLQRVQAAQLARRQIGELSGGQQQRVFIARALAQQAELLLLDEPFTGLDAPSREALFEILEGLHADGVTLMVATHDLNLAAEQFDRVMLLNRTMVAFGAAEAVLTTGNLQRAYGGHIHVVTNGDGSLLLADTCCEGR